MSESPPEQSIPELKISPWWGIWVQPRQTIRYLVDTDPKMHFWVLAVFYGVVRVVSWGMQIGIGDFFQPAGVAAFILLVGPLAGVFGIFVTAGLLQIAGRLFGGKATGPQLRAVLAWAAVPMSVLSFVGMVPLLFLFGQQVFIGSDPQMAAILFGQGDVGTFLGSGLGAWWAVLEGAGSMYYLITVVRGYAEVQQFGIWKAVGTFILAVSGLFLGALCMATVIVLIGPPV